MLEQTLMDQLVSRNGFHIYPFWIIYFENIKKYVSAFYINTKESENNNMEILTTLLGRYVIKSNSTRVQKKKYKFCKS